MAVAPLALAGMAVSTAASAAAAASQAAAQKGRAKGIAGISDRARVEAEKNRLKADARWREALKGLTPEAQEQAIEKAAGERVSLYNTIVGGGQEAQAKEGNVIETTDPNVGSRTKQEAAAQLADKLTKATAMMKARSAMGGWTDTLAGSDIAIGRSAQDISRLADFTAGRRRAAELAMAATAAKPLPGEGLRSGIKMGGQVIGSAMGGAGGLASGATGGVGSVLQSSLQDWIGKPGTSWWTTNLGKWAPSGGNAAAWGGTGEKL